VTSPQAHDDGDRSWRELVDRWMRVASALARARGQGEALSSATGWLELEQDGVIEWEQGAVTTLEIAHRLMDETRARFNEADLAEHSVARFAWEIHALQDSVVEAADALRERLFASDMSQRLDDSSGAAADSALMDFQIEPSAALRDGLRNVLTRPPRSGPEARWIQVMRQSSQDGFYRWLRGSVHANARDARRAGRRVRRPNRGTDSSAESAQILALAERARLTDRQTALALAVADGERLAAAARRLGISPATARQHWYRAKLKLKKAHLRGM
jgi:DNA-binding CsgD family transcriptional regulator